MTLQEHPEMLMGPKLKEFIIVSIFFVNLVIFLQHCIL